MKNQQVRTTLRSVEHRGGVCLQAVVFCCSFRDFSTLGRREKVLTFKWWVKEKEFQKEKRQAEVVLVEEARMQGLKVLEFKMKSN